MTIPADPQIAFRMQLKPGCEAEYKRRHDAIWPELATALKDAGIHDYSIFLDEETLALFAVMRVQSDNQQSGLAQQPVMRRWWLYMSDLMAVAPDNKPLEWPLHQVFRLE